MSNKRCRSDDTSERIHTHHKKLKDDHGDAQRVDPSRFDAAHGQTSSDKFDPFQMPLPSDDDADNDLDNGMMMKSRSSSNEPEMANLAKPDDSEFGLLLYELASLDVGNSNQQNNAPQTCPICSRRVSLKQFPDHVHQCLDTMDDSERHDLRSQVERDSDFATAYALKHGYQINYDFGQCPACGKQLILGNSMNEHVNLCLDEQAKREEMKKSGMEHEEDEDDDICFNNNANAKKKVEPLSREQMIECASKLMTLQQGTEQYDNMLDMFGALGFNKKNVKSVLEIEKKQQSNSNLHRNHSDDSKLAHDNQEMHNNGNQDNSNSMNNEDLSFLSPIAEEDVDLFGARHGNKANGNTLQSREQDEEQFAFDDDDL